MKMGEKDGSEKRKKKNAQALQPVETDITRRGVAPHNVARTLVPERESGLNPNTQARGSRKN